MQHSPVDLYLKLLERVLTGTLSATEPDVEDPRFVANFIRHYVEGTAYSMAPLARLANTRACVEDVIARGVPGDLIETGVWRGGMTIYMRAILAAHRVTDRKVWVADSFAGLPEPDAERFPLEASAHASRTMVDAYAHFAVSLEEVEGHFRTFGMLDDQVEFLPGWFKDTLRVAPIDRLALIRLDGDYYESTRDALEALYDRLSPGGFVIVDDYGEDAWTYCRQAVDEFRAGRGITEPLHRVDAKAFYWQRASVEAPSKDRAG